jgi:hypothetical protein
MRQSQNESIWAAESTSLSTSEQHKLLAASRRRAALAVLTDRTAPVALEDLTKAIVEREAAESSADEETRKEVTLTLHHTHLPKMTDLGVIEYDPAATEIVSCPHKSDS